MSPFHTNSKNRMENVSTSDVDPYIPPYYSQPYLEEVRADCVLCEPHNVMCPLSPLLSLAHNVMCSLSPLLSLAHNVMCPLSPLSSLAGVPVAGPREPHGGNTGECVLLRVHHLTQCHPLSSARPQVMCYRCLSQSSLSLSLNCAIVFKKCCNHIHSLSSLPPSLSLFSPSLSLLSLFVSLFLSPTTHYHITLSLNPHRVSTINVPSL